MTSVITLWRWVADLTDQKLIGMVDRKLSHDEMLVISSNEAINAHVAWPNGQKAKFLVKFALKWLQWPRGEPLVGDFKYQKFIGMVGGKVYQH